MNAPYRWGSNGPYSFDCSGFALKVLSDVGLFLPDMTAQGLYDYLLKNGYQSSKVEHDTIIFYGQDTEKIKHVSIGLNEKYIMEAGGAGRDSVNMSVEELAKKDARVRIKPLSNRKDIAAVIKLKY